MSAIDVKNLTGVQALRLFEDGQELSCPTCNAVLRPIPNDWNPSMHLSGLECPVSQAHYIAYADGSGQGLHDFRAWVKSVS